MSLLKELCELRVMMENADDTPSKKARSKVNSYYYRRTKNKPYRKYDPDKHDSSKQ